MEIELNKEKVTQLTSIIDQINQALLKDPESENRRVLVEKLGEIAKEISELKQILTQ